MMEFYVSGQSLKMFTPVIAADSLKYLTAQFHFTDDDWDGYTRWAHFRSGETVYDIELDGERLHLFKWQRDADSKGYNR